MHGAYLSHDFGLPPVASGAPRQCRMLDANSNPTMIIHSSSTSRFISVVRMVLLGPKATAKAPYEREKLYLCELLHHLAA